MSVEECCNEEKHASYQLTVPLLLSSDDETGETTTTVTTEHAEEHRPRDGVPVVPFPSPPTHNNTNDDDDDEGSSISSSKQNRNVALVLLYTFINFTGRGIWDQNCIQTLAYLLKSNDPKAIGFATAAMGIAQLASSIPTGILADRYRRDTLLRIGSCFGLAACATTIAGSLWLFSGQQRLLFFFRPTHYSVLVSSLVLWGFQAGTTNTAILALFSDSIPDGARSFYFTRRSILVNTGYMCGPAIALVVFAAMGNHWGIPDCSMVWLGGTLVALPGMVVLWFLSDDENDANGNGNDRDTDSENDSSAGASHYNNEIPNSVGEELWLRSSSSLTIASLCETGSTRSTSTTTANANDKNNNNSGFLEEILSRPHHNGTAVQGTTQIPRNSSNTTITPRTRPTPITTQQQTDGTYDEEKLGNLFNCYLLPRHRIVPFLVASADVTSGLASGLSTRYVAIFMYEKLGLGPVTVQVLYILKAVLQIGLRYQSQVWGRLHGRCRVSLCVKWWSIGLVFVMVGCYENGLPPLLVCGVLLLQIASMNATSSLTRSVLMDHVPRDERARWASLESVTMVSWSGSAVLGGILVDSYGLLFNFRATAVLQLVATLPLLLLGLYEDQEDNNNNNNSERETAVEEEHAETRSERNGTEALGSNEESTEEF